MTNSTIAPTLFSRLVCACTCAYAISSKTGGYAPPAIYHAGVNWTGNPTAISAPADGQPMGPRINACLVGLNQDGIVVAFRGTLPPAWTLASAEDWWQDIVDSCPRHHAPLPGKVHSGFWDALTTIWDGVLSEVQKLCMSNPGSKIFITGHSKGGPLASIAAARFVLEESIAASEVVTFASPHPGNGAFVAAYPQSLAVTRFENYLDLVPLLPPKDDFYHVVHNLLPKFLGREFCKYFPSICQALESAFDWDYTPLGTLSYVDASGKVVDASCPQAQVDFRLAQIVAELFDLESLEGVLEKSIGKPPDTGLTRIGAAHCISCESNNPNSYCAGGYMRGAGGNPICPSS